MSVTKLFAAGLLSASVPTHAMQVRDPLAITTDVADREVMAEAAAAVATHSPDLGRLDAILAKLPRPTPLRGMIQTVRAAVLARQRSAGPAVTAIEDALRLLPDDPRPKLVATAIFTFSGSPQRAADLWMQASREGPDLARESDRYVMSALTGRLNEIGDRVRADRINARLGEIGFGGGIAPERSATALARTREAVREGRTSDALQDVTAIGNPGDLLTLYVDRRYETLWPRIAEWAGADLSGQWRRYLEELRGDWTTTDSFTTATPYARSLANLDAYATVVDLFLPLFDRLNPNADDNGFLFLAPTVARSLARLGRQTEARALLAKAANATPADDQGNALNIDASYLTLATMEADWPQVASRAAAFLEKARALGPSIDRTSITDVRSWQACALWRTGFTVEARQVTAEVAIAGSVVPEAVMRMHVCRGDMASARTFVITRLADEATRGWALRYLQPTSTDMTTALDRVMKPVAQAVRTSADVVAAAAKVGRILLMPIGNGLPPGFEPVRAAPGTRPPGPDET